MIRYSIIIIIFILSLSGVYAQEEPQDSTETTNTEEIQVEGEIPDRLMTPDRQKMLEEGIFDLSDSLYKEPGFSRVRKGGTNTDLMLRGFHKDNLNFLMDGQRMHGACPNRMDPQMSHIDLGAVERFEVIRGPYDVKNPGSLGGAIKVITRRPKEGLHSSGNTGVTSFGGNFVNADASYGMKKFSILVGGSYSGMKPYRDGNGDRITGVYNDYWDTSYISQKYAPLTKQQNGLLNYFRDRAPNLYQQYRQASPSRNRYRYTERDKMTYTRRGGWTTLQFRPLEDHELEVQFARQEQDGIMYPFLFMDANYDHSTRGRASYTIKNISTHIKKFKIEGYTSEVNHLMTDTRRCSSTGDPLCLQHGNRPYSMATDATSQTSGGKMELTFLIQPKSTLTMGVDYYHRNWHTVTTNRSRHFMHPMVMSAMTTKRTPQPYRSQDAIPDATTENSGGYVEYKTPLTDSLKFSSGIRYDFSHSYAGVDRRVLYDVYYPKYDYYQFQYINYDVLDTRLDKEFYILEKAPDRKASAFSGYMKLDWQLNKEIMLHGGAGYAVRPPDQQELYFALQRGGTEMMPDFVGNPGLTNVRNTQTDTGIAFTNKKIRAEVNGYYSRVHGHIILSEINKNTGYLGNRDYTELAVYKEITGQDPTVNNRYARSYRNVEAEIYGGEFSGLLSVIGNWYLGSTISYTRGINRTENKELPEIPPFRGTAFLRWDIETYFAELEGLFADVQNRFDARVMERRTPGYGIANIKAGWKKDKIRLIVGVKNLFNRFYYDHLSYNRDFWSSGAVVPEPGTMLYATFQWKF